MYREYLDLNDVTIDVDLTANRGDCLGLKGLAREVGVLNSLEVTEPIIKTVLPTIDDKRLLLILMLLRHVLVI